MRINRVGLVITLVSLGVAALLFAFSRDWSPRFDPDLYRTTYQFFLLVVAGGAISWMYRELTRARQTQENHRQELLRLHADLVDSYNSYKEIKRLLRAKAWRRIPEGETEQDVLLVESYVPLLERLNKVQLTFEAHQRSRIKANPLLKPREVKRLSDNLRVVEGYINKVVKEFETALRSNRDEPYVELSALPHTEEFIGPGADSSGRRKTAVSSFRGSIELLEEVSSRAPSYR